MSLSVGIVGLPNVGKSTLFNALTRSKQADAQNYPFCIIDPNVGVVEVPDARLQKLAAVSQSQKIIPTVIEFVDIAGLVKGASEGEGLGNKFLSHIRETDAIVQVVRSFSDSNVAHVQNRVNPQEDADIINLELALADLETVTKKLGNTKRSAKGVAAKDFQKQIELLERVEARLQAGKPARDLEYNEDEILWMKELQLLTMKPMLYVVNVDENMELLSSPPFQGGVRGGLPSIEVNTSATPSSLPLGKGEMTDTPQIEISAKLEAELADLSEEEARQYLQELGMSESGLDKLITASYKLLNLITFFTSGEPETRAWTVKNGAKAPEAAGVIHTDFIKGFVKADVVNWQDFVAAGGWNKIKETGKMRLEGKEYVVQDGDVCYFHISS